MCPPPMEELSTTPGLITMFGATAPGGFGGELSGNPGARVSTGVNATAIASSTDDGVCPWDVPTRSSGFPASVTVVGRAPPSLPRLLSDRRGVGIAGAEVRAAPRTPASTSSPRRGQWQRREVRGTNSNILRM